MNWVVYERAEVTRPIYIPGARTSAGSFGFIVWGAQGAAIRLLQERGGGLCEHQERAMTHDHLVVR